LLRLYSMQKIQQGFILTYAKDTARIYVDNSGAIWSISNYRVCRYNAAANRFDTWIENNYASTSPNLHIHNCYTADAEGNIWQGAENGTLVKYDLAQKKVTDYSWLIPQTNATLVFCIYKDSHNNIWAGTDNGIIKISNNPAIFNNIPFSIGGKELKNIRCRRIIADRNNTWYAGTENYGFLKKTRTKEGNDTCIALSSLSAVAISDLPFTNNSLKLHLKGQYNIGYMYDM
jgi:ligand-binding sensor domain-containing protein